MYGVQTSEAKTNGLKCDTLQVLKQNQTDSKMRQTNLCTLDTALITYGGKTYDVRMIIVDNKFVFDPYVKYTASFDGIDYCMFHYASGKTVFMRNEHGTVSYASHKHDAGIISALKTLI